MRCFFQSLLSWLENGIAQAGLAGKHAHLRHTFALRAGENGNRLFSKLSVEVGTTLALIPVSHLIHPASSGMPEAKCSEPARLAAFLGIQRRHGEQSFWAPYIDSLPSAHAQLPRYFDKVFMDAHFKGSLFPDFVHCRTLEVQSQYRCLAEANPSRCVTWGDFQWGWDILDSRAASFTMEQQHNKPGIVLFPLLDIAQHDDFPNISCHFDEDLQALRCVAVRHIKPGDEVLNSYFDEYLGNWEAFERWGFTSMHMKRHHVALQVNFDDMPIITKDSGAGGRPRRPIPSQITFDLCNDAEDASTLRFLNFLQRLVNEADALPAEQRPDEVSSLRIGHDLLRTSLDAYPSDVVEDERRLASDLLDQRTRHSIILLRDEKKALFWWLAFLDHRVQQASSNKVLPLLRIVKKLFSHRGQ